MILTFGSVEEIRFIDCEHMGYNYAGFDIAHLYVGITGLEPGTLFQQQSVRENNWLKRSKIHFRQH